MLFKDLKTNLNKDFSSLPLRRLAVLGDSATQFLVQAIKAYGYQEKINFKIFEADFDQLNSEILDADSELYDSDPEFVVVYLSAERLWERFTATPPEFKADFSANILTEIQNWWSTDRYT